MGEAMLKRALVPIVVRAITANIRNNSCFISFCFLLRSMPESRKVKDEDGGIYKKTWASLPFTRPTFGGLRIALYRRTSNVETHEICSYTI